jgi:hypothetical protein
MMRRLIIAITVTALLVATAGIALATHVFSDVPDRSTHARGIHWAADNGIVRGYGDGTFGPNDAVTRGQLTTMLRRYHDAFPPDLFYSVEDTFTLTGNLESYTAFCEEGDIATGGGYSAADDQGDPTVVGVAGSWPTDDDDGWTVTAQQDAGGDTITVYVMCLE